MKRRPFPLAPIWDPEKRRGSIDVGSTPGTVFELVAWITDARLGNSSGMAKQGNYCFATSFTNKSIVSIDVSNPLNPTIVDELIDATNLNRANRIVVSSSGYAYITTGSTDRVTSIDISDPTNMALGNSLLDATDLDVTAGIAVDDSTDMLYVGTNDGVTVVDVSNPLGLSKAAVFNNASLLSAQAVALQSNEAFVSSTSGSLENISVLDITNPLSISLVGTKDLGGECHGLMVPDGNIVFWPEFFSSQRIRAVDITDPSDPTSIGSVVTSGTFVHSIAQSGQNYYVTSDGHVDKIQVSNPTSPTRVATVSDATVLGSAGNLVITHPYLFLITNDSYFAVCAIGPYA